jgi:hypothetical protein
MPATAYLATWVTVTGYTVAGIHAVHSQRRQNVPTHGSSYQRIIIGHCVPWLHVPVVHLRHSITYRPLMAHLGRARGLLVVAPHFYWGMRAWMPSVMRSAGDPAPSAA